MKRSALGGILTVTLVMTVLLIGYLFLSRTSSGYRMQKHQYTMSFFGDRIDALAKQRDLLLDSATSLEEGAAVLRKRVHMMDVEIENMRERLLSEKKESRTPFYSWQRFRFNTSSGLIVIAFLVFIWLLYTSARSASNSDGDDEDGIAAEPEVIAESSVLEEEFQPRKDPAPPSAAPEPAAADPEEMAESDAAEDHPPGDGEESAEAGEDPSDPSEEEETGEKKDL